MLAARFSIMLAAVLWSTAGAAIKLAGLSAWQLSAGRSVVAALALWMVFPEARRRLDRHLLWVATAYGFTGVLFVAANKLTTAANAIFIQDCAPLYVLLLSPLILGERPTRQELAAAPIYALGMGLFFVDKLGPGAWQGNLLAVVSGVAFALNIMGVRRLRDGGALAAAVWGNVMAAAVCAPLAIQGPVPTLQDVGIVVFLGVVQQACAYTAFSHGVKRVTAAEASLLILLEPVLSAVWAFLLAGETPGPFALCGAAIVLAATAWRTVSAARLSAA